MASCRVRAAVHHDHVSMRRQRRRSMPSGRCMARQRAFTAGIQRSARALCAAAGERAGDCASGGGREPRGRPRDPERPLRQPQNRQGLGTCGSCAFMPRQASFPSCRAPAAVEDPGSRPATLTDWPVTARGSSCGRLGERNGCPASGVLPVWPIFLQHRRRCVSIVRWRANLIIHAGVVLIAAEGRAS
jgi:hypothetical protein